jgi:hypothetical protein
MSDAQQACLRHLRDDGAGDRREVPTMPTEPTPGELLDPETFPAGTSAAWLREQAAKARGEF